MTSEPTNPGSGESKPPQTPAPAPKPATTPAASPAPAASASAHASSEAKPAVAHAAAAPAAKPAAAPAKETPKENAPIGLHPYPDPNRREFMFGSVAWFRVGWLVFTAGAAATGGALQRFLFPNVLYEPPQVFKAGNPSDYPANQTYVDERFKEKYAAWVVRTPNDSATGKAGFYAITTVCTHLGCTPNYLASESKFKCPCHGSGFQTSGINFEGPAPRPLERFRIVIADDGQILVDKTVKYQQEKGEWEKPESFLLYTA